MAAAGHNSGEISQDDLDVLWAIHTRNVLKLKEQRKEIDEALKAELVDAKNDGFDRKEIVDYVDVMTSDDQKKHVDKFNMMKRNRERLGLIPRASGRDLFEDRATKEQLIDADGYECGLNALPKNPRHTSGADQERIWMDAYQRGYKKHWDNWQRVTEEKIARRAAAEAAKSNEEPPPAAGDDPFEDAA
jgi:hypothetical protein